MISDCIIIRWYFVITDLRYEINYVINFSAAILTFKVSNEIDVKQS